MHAIASLLYVVAHVAGLIGSTLSQRLRLVAHPANRIRDLIRLRTALIAQLILRLVNQPASLTGGFVLHLPCLIFRGLGYL